MKANKKILFLYLVLFLNVQLNGQCNYSYLPGEVVMDDSSGRIYMFRKIEDGKVTFRVNSNNPQVHLNMPFTKPCKEINLIKPFFEEGDIIHSWDDGSFAVKEYQPKWDTDNRQLITIIRETNERISTETIQLNWRWIERIEKNNAYQDRLKKFQKEQLVFWKTETGDTLNGWVKYIYSKKNSLKIERYTLENRIATEDIEVEKIVSKHERTLHSFRDTIDMIRTNWRSENILVLDLEKKEKYSKENNIRVLELNDEYKLYRHDDFHKWSDEKKYKAGYNYSFAGKATFADSNGEIITFGHAYKGITSTWDRWMTAARWKYENNYIHIENGYVKLLFEITYLNKNHLHLILKRYENKLLKN